MCSGGDVFVPRNRTGVKESLHRRLAKTPASLMWPFLVVAPDPFIKIGLQGLDRSVELLADRDTVELVEDGLVKALDNAIRLWALRLGPRMVNVFHREIRLVVVIRLPICKPAGRHRASRIGDGPNGTYPICWLGYSQRADLDRSGGEWALWSGGIPRRNCQ